jgi:hypothetical protein
MIFPMPRTSGLGQAPLKGQDQIQVLKDPSALQQPYDQDDQGDNDERVDQAAADVEREKPQGPQNDQDDHEGF